MPAVIQPTGAVLVHSKVFSWSVSQFPQVQTKGNKVLVRQLSYSRSLAIDGLREGNLRSLSKTQDLPKSDCKRATSLDDKFSIRFAYLPASPFLYASINLRMPTLRSTLCFYPIDKSFDESRVFLKVPSSILESKIGSPSNSASSEISSARFLCIFHTQCPH